MATFQQNFVPVQIQKSRFTEKNIDLQIIDCKML